MGRRRRVITIGLVGVLIGLVANAITASAALSLFDEPVGARIRPMGQALMFFCGALVGLCGAVVSFQAVRQDGSRWAGAIGLVLGLSPFPLGSFLIRYVQELRHLDFLP
jgi:hypothetical protein